MGTRTPDCRKFTPNIFNKSKCSHCFRQREEHSAAALECNRASRKVSKCGYLFVAPDWDFNNPLYRTKILLQGIFSENKLQRIVGTIVVSIYCDFAMIRLCKNRLVPATGAVSGHLYV
ncbi:unnamed protein product [Hermetia illucens]|uniref:Protein outspread n=1 Tax=Hermetia illucens TaxID=343691 RepID=A0A7R8USJ7_HERIL|nr:unnamed protein product [Hermetia illucens]